MTPRWLFDAQSQGFGPDNLPYGVFAPPGAAPRVGVRIGDHVLDVSRILRDPEFARGSLNAFMARGSTAWRAARSKIGGRFATEAKRRALEPHLHPLAEVSLHPPFDVADLFSFRGAIEDSPEPGMENRWHLPQGVHGRSGAVVLAGRHLTPPRGLLNVGAGLGFVVGSGSEMGRMVTTGDFAQHVFGVVLVSEWMMRDPARDDAPLCAVRSPSFATSISPWVIPLDALGAARVPGRPQHPPVLPHLRRVADWGLDITMDVHLNGARAANPSAATLYWTGDQMLAHLTSNGAKLRTGDLYTTGPVCGPWPGPATPECDDRGATPACAPEGRYLRDGDGVTITAWARGLAGGTINFGEVGGTVTAGTTT